MKDYLKISVIIPVYNAEETLRFTLRSVANQTVAVGEVIIINDASTDNSLALAQALAKHYEGFLSIHIINFKENQGVSAARNAGIQAAKYPIHAFLDADDQWHLEKVKIINQFFSYYPQAIGFAHKFDTKPSYIHVDNVKFKKDSFYRNLIKNRGQGSSIIISNPGKSIIFNPKMRYAEDYDFYNRVLGLGQMYYCPSTLTIIGREMGSKGGLSGKRWAMRKGELITYKNIAHYRWYLIWAIPLLWIYSLVKHLIKHVVGLLPLS